MYQTSAEIYKKSRRVGLEFVENEIISERINKKIDQVDQEYLNALGVVLNRLINAIARESKDDGYTKSSN